MQLGRCSLLRQRREVIGESGIEIFRQPDHGAQRARYDQRRDNQQARYQRADWQKGSNCHVVRGVISNRGRLRGGISASIRSRSQQHADRLSLPTRCMQAILQPGKETFVRCAVRNIPELDQPYLRVLLNFGKRPAAVETAILDEAGDLNQGRILDFDGFIERLPIGEYAPDRASQYDQGSQANEETAAQGRDHDARSTIQPTPRTLRIAVAPSFLRTVWIRNSMALLSTSSFQP